MTLSTASRIVRESTVAKYTAVLQDENGLVVSVDELDTLTLTLYNLADGTIINSRAEQTVLNTHNVTLDGSGNLAWEVQPSDNIIVGTHLRAGELEPHMALFQWTWDSGQKQGRYEVQIDVQQVSEIPLSLGATVVSSWGGYGSNSYVSLTDASSYITNSIIANTSWHTATPIQKVAALLEATRDIDSLNFIGERYYYDQSLSCPRELAISWPYNRTSTSSTVFSISYEQQREDIRRATCHQAVWLLRNSGINSRAEEVAAGIISSSKRIGPIAESYEYGKGAIATSKQPVCLDAMRFVKRWITSARVVRA